MTSHKSRHWVRRGAVSILLFAGLVWAGDAGISLLVQHSRLRVKITARLEAAFGRPVEVGSYGFSIWYGPVLEAHSVRIGEDPRFGYEYFVRADSISVGLHWWKLLRGHIALGNLSVRGASLNLVRGADGDWNLAEWLPKPPTGEATAVPGANTTAPPPALQFHRVDISDSRIDFKRGNKKLAFALVDVNGSMETDAPGRWRIDLTASPWRAAVVTQRPGVIQVSGHIGGTSSRLRPAALEITWTDASIADFSRLAYGDDYGIRGNVDVSLSAHTEPSEPVNGWVLNGNAAIRGLHRWDIAARPDNPALNFIVKQALLDPSLSEARVSDLHIEAPHSTAHANAAFNWTGAPHAGKTAIASSNFVNLISSQIDLSDVLDWVRAFHQGMPNSTAVRGIVDVRAHLAGWPPNLASASVTGNHAELVAAGLHGPMRIGPIDLRFQRGAITLQPASVAWSDAGDRAVGSFRIDSSTRARAAIYPSWHVAGSAEDAGGIAKLATALGLNLLGGWDLQGPLSCDLRWQGGLFPWDSRPVGSITLGTDGARSGGASLRAPFLNLPVEQIRARVEMKPGASEVALTSAEAFGSNWSGTFERRTADAEWQFALSADRLSAADLDRWLNPRWRESFLDRVLPFLGASAKAISPEELRASGTLDVGEFVLEPLSLRHLMGNLRIDGRNLEFSDAQGQFYGGAASGLLRANLSAVPSYHSELTISRVNASSLDAATTALAGLGAKMIEGQISIEAKGATRSDLIASMACRGEARATGIELPAGNLDKALGGSLLTGSGAPISAGSAAFECSQRAVQFQKLSLLLRDGSSLTGSGSVGFDRIVNLRFQDASRASTDRVGATFQLTGDLASPEITRAAPRHRGR